MEMESILENLKVLNNAVFVISGALNFKNLVNFSLKKGHGHFGRIANLSHLCYRITATR